MPDRVLLSALDLKRADYDRLALRPAHTTAEIKFSDQRKAFLSTMREQPGGDLAVSGASLDILEQFLAMRGLTEPADNQNHLRNVRAQELLALAIAASDLGHLVGPQGLRWPGEDAVETEKDAEDDDYGSEDEGHKSLRALM